MMLHLSTVVPRIRYCCYFSVLMLVVGLALAVGTSIDCCCRNGDGTREESVQVMGKFACEVRCHYLFIAVLSFVGCSVC